MSNDEENQEIERSTTSIMDCFNWITYWLTSTARKREYKLRLKSKLMEDSTTIQEKIAEINRKTMTIHENVMMLNHIGERFPDKTRIPIQEKKRQAAYRHTVTEYRRDILQLDKEVKALRSRHDRYNTMLQLDHLAEGDLSYEELANKGGLNPKQMTKKQERAEQFKQERTELTTAMTARLELGMDESVELDYFNPDEPLEEEKQHMEDIKKAIEYDSKVKQLHYINERARQHTQHAQDTEEYKEHRSIEIAPAESKTEEIDEFNPQ